MKPLLALLLAVAGISGVWARDIGHDEARALSQARRILPLEQITARALQDHPGARLLEVELEEDDGILVYEIELLTADGVVRELELDASNARVLKDEVD